jgi:Domain of unknown function (DUF4136)
MTLQRLQILTLITCVLLGCATDPIEVSGEPTLLRPFSTFRVHEEQFAFATAISEEERAQVGSELRKAAVTAFTEHGYKEASDPDVLVSLGAISRLTLDEDAGSSGEGHIRFVDPSVLEPGRPTSAPGAEPTPSGVGREGDLFLYLVDPKTKRVIWRANTSGSATTPSEAVRKARRTYSAMVAKLPAAVASGKR